MKLIEEKNGYTYWIGKAKGKPIFNVSPSGQKPPVTGYPNPKYLEEAKNYKIDMEVFAPYVLTKERAEAALKAATVSRGKNKGMLLAKCPKIDTDAAACWQAITGFANPFKTGLCHMMFMSDAKMVIYNYFVHVIEMKMIDVRAMDRDRKTLDLILNIW